MRIQVLGSSSSGNSALVETPECKLLIDAGFSARQLKRLAKEAGESLDGLDAVLLTHEHSDHSAGLRGLAKTPGLSVFGNRGTLNGVRNKVTRPLSWKTFETGTTFAFRDLRISTFSVPHDAADPVGYLLEWGDGTLFRPFRSLAWVTDLGYATDLVRQRIRQADLVVVESNHDVAMLEADTGRPWSTKQRIKGRHGHLSNDAAFEWLRDSEGARWQKVWLAHLSRDCNCLEIVQNRFGDLARERRWALEVIDPVGGRQPRCNLGVAS
ncbi:MAG: MBL fold metallo-hydrolase [Opitutales bacterium]